MGGASIDIVPTDALGRPRLSALTSPRQVATPRQAVVTPRQAATPDLKQLQQVTELHCRKLVKMESTLGSIEARLTPRQAFNCEPSARNTDDGTNLTLDATRFEMDRSLAHLRGELEAKLDKVANEFERIKAELSVAKANQGELKRLREGLQIFWGELDQKCCTRTAALQGDLDKNMADLVGEVSVLKDGHESILSVQSRLRSLEDRFNSLKTSPSACLHDTAATPAQLVALRTTLEQQAMSLQRYEAALAVAVRRVDALEFAVGSSSGREDASAPQAAPGIARAVHNSLSSSQRNSCTAMKRGDATLCHSGAPNVSRQKEAGSESPEQTEGEPFAGSGDCSTITGSPCTDRDDLWKASSGAQEADLEVKERRIEEAAKTLTAVFDQIKQSHQSQTMLTQESVAAAETALSTSLNSIRGLLSECTSQARSIQMDAQRQHQQGSAGKLAAKPLQALAATTMETLEMQTSGNAEECTVSQLLTPVSFSGPMDVEPSSPAKVPAASCVTCAPSICQTNAAEFASIRSYAMS